MFYYGLKSKKDAIEIVSCLMSVTDKNQDENIKALLLETACAETMLGQYKDPTPHSAGSGVTQIDEPTFNWLCDKNRDRRINDHLIENFCINLNTVQYYELNVDPLLSFLFTRLRYKTITDLVPDTLEGRAAYWKKFYNTSAGAGTASEYITKANKYLYS